jgi:hypothetical protein
VTLTRFFVGSAMAMAMACSDTTAPNTIGAAGSLSFSFTNAGTAGSYSATGAVPTDVSVNFGSKPWATGTTDNTNQTILIGAAVPRSGSTWDVASIQLAGQTTGTKTIDPNCGASKCTEVLMDFGATQSETNFQLACTLTTGTVVVTSLSSSHVAGTFSGSGTCFSSAGNTTPFTVTNGAFDVALVSGIFL